MLHSYRSRISKLWLPSLKRFSVRFPTTPSRGWLISKGCVVTIRYRMRIRWRWPFPDGCWALVRAWTTLPVVKSLLRVRGMVREYLGDVPQQRRQQILSQLRSEEGAQAPLLARLLETMKPPQLPPPIGEEDPPGLFRLQARDAFGGTTEYLVQVPPEYDPNRKYPCILALPGRGDHPEIEINAWCGIYAKLAYSSARSGHATRHGYIVVSPNWMTENQAEYQYTEQEHDRILRSLRDAFRKFSIDTDRVFVTGHFDGATAAWDLAVSHPDLWAGAIMISPGADKYILSV